jgi:hypothetical protein
MTHRRRPSKLLALLPFPIGKREWLAIVFGAAIAGVVLFAALKFPAEQRTSASFGPDWECTSVGGGDSVCLKKPPRLSGTAGPADAPAR